jgi:16S rRNA (uracil1498-N3)-methyltransferase
LNQVFSDQLPAVGETLRLGGDERHYLGRVLRARTGELVRVVDGLGHARVAVLRGFEGDLALLEIQREAVEATEPWVFHLGLCAPKGDALELALEAAVQMGVESITLVKSKRTQANFDGGALQPERLQRRLVEASRQCERSKVPFLLGPVRWRR